MLIVIIIVSIYTLYKILFDAAATGTFGIRIWRFINIYVDKKESDTLLRLLARYNTGELQLQKSLYGDNLVFIKTSTPTENSDITYNESTYYVNIGLKMSGNFGKISKEPIIWKNTKSGINLKSYDELIKVLNTFNEELEKNKLFKKISNEEIHLS